MNNQNYTKLDKKTEFKIYINNKCFTNNNNYT